MTPVKCDLIRTFKREEMHATRSHAARRRFLAEANLRAIDEYNDARRSLRGMVASALYGFGLIAIMVYILDAYMFGLLP